MPYETHVDPISGYATNISAINPLLVTFLTANGWTIESTWNTDANTWGTVATNPSATGSIFFGNNSDHANNSYMYFKIGTSYSGSGDTLNNECNKTLINWSYIHYAGYTAPYYDTKFYFVANDDDFWVFCVNTSLDDVSSYIGEYIHDATSWFGFGDLTKYGSWTGGLWMQQPQYQYNEFWHQIINYSTQTILTGDIGGAGTPPYMYSGLGATGINELLPFAPRMDVNIDSRIVGNMQTQNLSITLLPSNVYLAQDGSATLSWTPLGRITNMFITKAKGIYKAGDVIDYLGHQYLLFSSGITTPNTKHDVDLAFKID